VIPAPSRTRADETYRYSAIGAGLGELHAAALAYAAIGWPVFPLAPGEKVPLYSNPHRRGSEERTRCPGRAGCGRDGHGVKDATVDPAVITAWWVRTPRANIGLGCGVTASGHGPDVVDFDVKDGAPGLASFQRLRDVGLLAGAFAMVTTPSGGWHLYYEGSHQANSVIRGYGVDFRSSGGYVVGPESVTARGMYAWSQIRSLPERGVDWQRIRDFLKPPPPIPALSALRRQADPSVNGLVRWMMDQTAGSENRNSGLYWACCRALEAGHLLEDLEPLADAARRTGLGEDEIRKSITSAQRRVGVR
jgi:hypothetical protein